MKSEVFENLSSLGCCEICCLRFCGETKVEVFKDIHPSFVKDTMNEDVDDLNSSCTVKKVASNACVACLGLLQPPMCDRVIDRIVEAVGREEYDNPTFKIAFTLPVSFYLRAHSVLVYLVNKHPDYFKANFPLGVVTVGVKDAWKYRFCDEVAARIHKTFDNDADLRVQVDVQYEDDHDEIQCLLLMYPSRFNDQKIKKRKLRHLEGPMLLFSRSTVETVLELQDREHFAKFYPVPPTIPTHSAVCNNVMFEHAPVYIAGRYNKYVRGLPQTAWLVQDQRKMETSVHELIGDAVQEVTKAQGSKLISSGREDVDVRMLGSGRPFALELTGARHVAFTAQELKLLEHRINTEAKGKVAVSQLTVVPKLTLELLKTGEEHKTKTYMAYCVAWHVDKDKLSSVSERAPLTLEQKTPVRVLHRRSIATRPRTIHWMTVSDVTSSESDGVCYFKLRLNAQAGTYIKEFVHGDFGRTSPSLGDLLGGVAADCLALDVESIALDWPPE